MQLYWIHKSKINWSEAKECLPVIISQVDIFVSAMIPDHSCRHLAFGSHSWSSPLRRKPVPRASAGCNRLYNHILYSDIINIIFY